MAGLWFPWKIYSDNPNILCLNIKAWNHPACDQAHGSASQPWDTLGALQKLEAKSARIAPPRDCDVALPKTRFLVKEAHFTAQSQCFMTLVHLGASVSQDMILLNSIQTEKWTLCGLHVCGLFSHFALFGQLFHGAGYGRVDFMTYVNPKWNSKRSRSMVSCSMGPGEFITYVEPQPLVPWVMVIHGMFFSAACVFLVLAMQILEYPHYFIVYWRALMRASDNMFRACRPSNLQSPRVQTSALRMENNFGSSDLLRPSNKSLGLIHMPEISWVPALLYSDPYIGRRSSFSSKNHTFQAVPYETTPGLEICWPNTTPNKAHRCSNGQGRDVFQ